MGPERLVFLSVVPSPYQRDLFFALADRKRLPLRVHYLENAAPDSPWPATDSAPWENVLPGFTLGRGRWRSHVNWRMPAPKPGDFWVVNAAMTDVTTQRVMRRLGRATPWCFWGELPSRPRSAPRVWLQRRQYAPLAAARAIVAVGERARQTYAEMIPGVRAFNQPYACRLDDFEAAAAQRTPNAEPVFIFCGQMIARKGIDLLLSAFAMLVRDGVAARLELVGREAELPPLLAALPDAARRRITYRGFLAPADLPAAFARADVFVLPSRHDGWGVVVNQALGAGLPVIASDAVGAAHDLVEPDVSGLIVPSGDAPALAVALRRLAESPAMRARLGAAAALRAKALTPDRAAQFWEELAGTFVTG